MVINTIIINRTMRKIHLLLIMFFLGLFHTYGQSINMERTALANYLVRMYENQPFEGVRIVNDYTDTYLISVLSLDTKKYNSNESTMNRVASVKAVSQVSRFFNGSSISSELVINIRENGNNESTTEITEIIKEHSLGYVSAVELLTSFDTDLGKRVFIYIKKLEKENK